MNNDPESPSSKMANTNDYAPWVPDDTSVQAKAEAEEQIKLSSSASVIQDVMDWLEMKRAQYRGIDIIAGANPSSNANDIKSAVLLNQAMGAEMDMLLKNFRVEFSKYIHEKPMHE